MKKKLDQASSSIEDAERKTRTIHRALGKVEAPQVEDQAVALPEVALLDALGATEDVEEIDAQEMAV